jgi:hypothetical protein
LHQGEQDIVLVNSGAHGADDFSFTHGVFSYSISGSNFSCLRIT